MSNRCGACGQPRDAWKTIEKTVAVMVERAKNPPKCRPSTGALKFMKRLAVEGGRIVSTASLTPEQVIAARESQRLFVTGEGLGFVIFPDGVGAAGVDALDQVRYCYECGSMGPVPPDKRDCCPDGSHARMVPQVIAQQARRGFEAMYPPARVCTCFPDEARPSVCQQKFALCECRKAAGLPDLFDDPVGDGIGHV